MLLYLAGSTCLDISYNAHQCAIILHAPKASHEIELKYISRYLKGTRDKGLIMKPGVKYPKVNLFADADFAGLFGSEDKMDLISVNSRTCSLL